MANIKALKQLKEAHSDFESTGIERFNQNRYSSKSSVDYGICGCVGHTADFLGICTLHDSWHNYFGITDDEVTYIFGFSVDIEKLCKRTGWPNSGKYTANDAADRIEFVINKYEGKTK